MRLCQISELSEHLN